MKWQISPLVVLVGVLLCVGIEAATAKGASPEVVAICEESNDLYQAIKHTSLNCSRHASFDAAIAAAHNGCVVLLLAQDYPTTSTHVDAELLEKARSKGLRLYIECPDAVPGCAFGARATATWERVVVTTNSVTASLAPLSILSISGCEYLPTTSSRAVLSLARVAGYDNAVYGLPPESKPLLFEVPEYGALVATTRLSSFVTGRYAPLHRWELVWRDILSFLLGEPAPPIKLEPAVRPAFAADVELPAAAQANAVRSAAEWIVQSKLLLTSERASRVRDQLLSGAELQPCDRSAGTGDGSNGILEGYSSAIEWNGMQKQRLPIRADCQAESAMLLAINSQLTDERAHAVVARNLMNYLYNTPTFYSRGRDNPTSAGYGLVAWGAFAPAWEVANYGDDNARVILAALVAAATLQQDNWDAAILRAIAANFRTTGRNGFRGDRIDMPELDTKGWKYFADRQITNFAPHFESWLWACYLLAYEQTGYKPFLNLARAGITQTMEVYPKGWRLGDNSERARMLLSLAWLVRLDDTAQHREWLEQVARDLVSRMAPCGAIPEYLAGSGGGHYQVPQSNDAYGTGECPLLQENGDPVSDQLYTTGFALLGLHEAAAVSSGTLCADSERRLAEYLCRIQVRSETFPFLNGAWLRAFDFKKWDYWANSCDAGWGPWCAEAGWGHTWIGTTLALREQKQSLWQLLTSRSFAPAWPAVQREMFPVAAN